MSDNLILIGGGGHCKSCIDVIEQENKYRICGILDIPSKLGHSILNYTVIGTDEDIEKYARQGYSFLVTVGQIHSAELRIKLYEKIKAARAKCATIISPRAYVSKYASVGAGSIVMHHALINAGARIGNNCIINTQAIIEHECVVDDNCHIAIGAVLAGNVHVNAASFVGANATIVQQITVPAGSFIKAGTLYLPKYPNQ